MRRSSFKKLLNTIAIFILASICVEGHLPGINLKTYKTGELIPVSVGKIYSHKTQIPYTYLVLPYCPPASLESTTDNLGEILSGDYTFRSNYNFTMNENTFCRQLCGPMKFDKHQIGLLQWLISNYYYMSYYVDSLPAGLNLTDGTYHHFDANYDVGLPIGHLNKETNEFYIFNHFTFTIEIYEKPRTQKEKQDNKPVDYYITAFNAAPISINNFDRKNNQTSTNCKNHQTEWSDNYKVGNNYLEENKTVYFTYDYVFRKTNDTYATRWDHYLKKKGTGQESIHWLSLVSGVVFVLIFAVLVFNIFCKSVRSDIELINSAAFSENAIEETRWKQISNEVFRGPYRPMIFSAMVGTGIQIALMSVYTLVFAWIGFVSPAERGSALTVLILIFVFCGVFSGYYSARFYKMFGGDKWLKNALLSAFLYPSIAMTIFLTINMFLWAEGSSAAVPFPNILAMLLLWICCSSPLVLIGAFIGVKKKKMANPCKVNPLPYQIPVQPWYLNWKVSMVVAGIFPFCTIFVELIYVMSSVWYQKFYSLFGFLYIIIILLGLISAEISIIITYIQLCKQDYRWWWKSFLVGGSSSLYIFGYAVFYYFSSLGSIRLTSIILYFGYMFLVSASVFLMTGAVSFLSTYIFMKKIYSMIKIN